MKDQLSGKYVKKLHESLLTLDTHIDIEVTSITPEKPREIGNEKMASFSKMNKGCLDGAFFAAYVPQESLDTDKYRQALALAMRKIGMIHYAVDKNADNEFAIAYHPDDVYRINKERKKIVIIGVENGYPIGADIGNIGMLYNQGTRYITLCHNGHNQLCDSNMNPGGPESIHNGLSSLGEEIVIEMNRIGMIIDISHCSKKTTLDAIALSKAPVIASHSACRAICDETRNLDDEQLLALKRNEGVINIIAITEYIKKSSPERVKAVNKLRKKYDMPQDFWKFLCRFPSESLETRDAYLQELQNIDKRIPPASVKEYVDHIDHVVKLIGIDHVGVGSDYYSTNLALQDWKDAGEIFRVTQELVRRGYSEKDIEKIWSGNILRVWKTVEKNALENK